MYKVHFIAVGGAVMHNLAIALHKKGYKVTGSDDLIFEPSRSRLKKYGLLPEKEGWDTGRIDQNLDFIILGMHAKKENPELIKCKELGLKVLSFPEFLYEETKNKKRIVIGGSHGKTTITSMIMHVLKYNNVKFDYMVGSHIGGFETMVGLSDENKLAVFEGDEYLTSPLDPRPKFHLYKPHIAVLTGIAWDHMNVFPTVQNYVEQFDIFIDKIEPGGKLFYYGEDASLKVLTRNKKHLSEIRGYGAHPSVNKNDTTCLLSNDKEIPVHVFGNHNMENIQSTKLVCNSLGIADHNFYEAIKSFRGAARRLEKIYESNKLTIYRDFAHAPSKLKATIDAIKLKYADKKIIACMELHTYSSLNRDFLPQYNGSMINADVPFIFFDPIIIENKGLPFIDEEDIKKAFNQKSIVVFKNSEALKKSILSVIEEESILLLMSSGSFSGMEMSDFFI